MKLVIIVVTFFIVSCNGQKKTVMADNTKADLENNLALVMNEEQGGFETDEMLVIRDLKRLKTFFSKVNRTRKPGLPLPDIDFSRDMVLILCIKEGSHNSTGILSLSKETTTQVVLRSKDLKKAKNNTRVPAASSFKVYKLPITEKEVIVEK